MGSDSDLPVMQDCINVLKEFAVPFEVHISSAHRLPEETASLAKNASLKGIKVIVAGAGAAAHLAGVMASYTTLPVIGVPLSSPPLGGVDALYATVQMPKGVPVATVAINGAYNAGLLAVQILALEDPKLFQALKEFKEKLAEKVHSKRKELEKFYS
ncbi:MAG: 5-(carboxyamino)imidazole ribonucleotide mutase [Firmicutes bacterium]|nr:5-(carboxyamino)imidazole ribonucleotide mutase [Bacillota bacterium]